MEDKHELAPVISVGQHLPNNVIDVAVAFSGMLIDFEAALKLLEHAKGLMAASCIANSGIVKRLESASRDVKLLVVQFDAILNALHVLEYGTPRRRD
jgi:hypothetical protein